MKATGIVRRIDDLGRVVIPKEIRRTLHIREGVPREIFVTPQGEVVFRKYSPLLQFGRQAQACADALFRTAAITCLVADRDGVIAAAGIPKKDALPWQLPPEALRSMEERTFVDETVLLPKIGCCRTFFSPIVSGGDVLGCVIAAAGDLPDGGEKLARAAAQFLACGLEE